MKGHSQIQVVLVGTGNVAWHLGHALAEKGIRIIQVLSRNTSSASELAKELNAGNSGKPEDMDPNADMCLICVSDDAILSVLKKLRPGNCLLLHTSGSIPMDVFRGLANNYGVLYPLQTFTRGIPLQYHQIPFMIEANSADNLLNIRQLAEVISRNVAEADSVQRLYLHLAAVFAGNFSNHMFYLAEKLTREHGLSFDILKPLIEEIASKAMHISPQKAQTGPAVRGDRRIIEKHLELLTDKPDLQELYRLISESIRKVTGDG